MPIHEITLESLAKKYPLSRGPYRRLEQISPLLDQAEALKIKHTIGKRNPLTKRLNAIKQQLFAEQSSLKNLLQRLDTISNEQINEEFMRIDDVLMHGVHADLYRLVLDMMAIGTESYLDIPTALRQDALLVRELFHTMGVGFDAVTFEDYFAQKRSEKKGYKIIVRELKILSDTGAAATNSLYLHQEFRGYQDGTDRLLVVRFPSLSKEDFHNNVLRTQPGLVPRTPIVKETFCENNTLILLLKDFVAPVFDLHGQGRDTALEITDEYLRDSIMEFKPQAVVVSGKGLHSKVFMQPVIKPAILDDLERRKTVSEGELVSSFGIDPKNEGRIKVSLGKIAVIKATDTFLKLAESIKNIGHIFAVNYADMVAQVRQLIAKKIHRIQIILGEHVAYPDSTLRQLQKSILTAKDLVPQEMYKSVGRHAIEQDGNSNRVRLLFSYDEATRNYFNGECSIPYNELDSDSTSTNTVSTSTFTDSETTLSKPSQGARHRAKKAAGLG